jgi:hypothetical protein
MSPHVVSVFPPQPNHLLANHDSGARKEKLQSPSSLRSFTFGSGAPSSHAHVGASSLAAGVALADALGSGGAAVLAGAAPLADALNAAAGPGLVCLPQAMSPTKAAASNARTFIETPGQA